MPGRKDSASERRRQRSDRVTVSILENPMIHRQSLPFAARRSRGAAQLEVLVTLALILVTAVAATVAAQQAAPSSARSESYPIGTRANFTAPEFSSASFRSMDRIFFTRRVPRSGAVAPLERGAQPFSVRYRHEGAEYGVEDLVKRTDTTGLLVLHDGTILHEGYYRGADETSRFLSMSVGKSFVSTLVGLAIGERLIASVDDPVTRYLPELAGTGYDGVTMPSRSCRCRPEWTSPRSTTSPTPTSSSCSRR